MTPEAVLLGVIALGLLFALALMMRRNAAVAGIGPAAAMELWERRAAELPQHADLGRVFDRLAAVERSVERLSGEMQGVREMGLRTEGYVRILVQHQLDEEGK